MPKPSQLQTRHPASPGGIGTRRHTRPSVAGRLAATHLQRSESSRGSLPRARAFVTRCGVSRQRSRPLGRVASIFGSVAGSFHSVAGGRSSVASERRSVARASRCVGSACGSVAGEPGTVSKLFRSVAGERRGVVGGCRSVARGFESVPQRCAPLPESCAASQESSGAQPEISAALQRDGGRRPRFKAAAGLPSSSPASSAAACRSRPP